MTRWLQWPMIGMLCGLLWSAPAWADLQQQLNDLADSLGVMTATTTPGAYEGQTRGYLTGGGMSLRFPQASLDLASINLPKVRAGCEGIDLYLGAFSYINTDQLIAKLRAIGSASLGYAFQLALEAISPQISGIIKHFENVTERINNLNLSSCQAARALVDATGLPEKIRSSQIGRCTGSRTASGASPDYSAARQACAADPSTGVVGDAEDQAQGRRDRNYLWEALSNLSGVDEPSRELILSTLGTVVAVNDQVISWQPIVSFDQFVDGGNITRYDCTGDCLVQATVSEPTATGLTELVRQRMEGILDQVRTRQALSAANINFVSAAPLPLYRMVNALSTLTPAVADSYLAQWAEPLALLMAQHWVDTTARQARRALSVAKVESAVQEAIERQIAETQEDIRTRVQRTRFVMDSIRVEVEMLERVERAMMRNLSAHGLEAAYQFSRTPGP
ncbi:MAG: conjugal transfer protein TraH [Nitrospirota bacterium]